MNIFTKILIGLNIALLILCATLLLRDNGHAESIHEHKALESQVVSAVMSQVDQKMLDQLEKIKAENNHIVQAPINSNVDASLPEPVITLAEEAPETLVEVDPALQEQHRAAAERYKATLAANLASGKAMFTDGGSQNRQSSEAVSCGNLPALISALEQIQLTPDQISDLDTELEAYLNEIDHYTACLDAAIAALAPADATQAFYESANYQNDFDTLRDQIIPAESQKEIVLERHNYLLENATIQQSN